MVKHRSHVIMIVIEYDHSIASANQRRLLSLLQLSYLYPEEIPLDLKCLGENTSANDDQPRTWDEAVNMKRQLFRSKHRHPRPSTRQ
jgi:hypothetical protein